MADDTDDTDDDGSVIQLARDRFDACLTLRAHWERLALQDLKFKAGTDGEKSYQWDQTVQSQRNTENRPCFTINRIPSFIKQVVNQQRQAGPSVQVSAIGAGDDGVAEVLQGLIRHIVNLSDGEIAIDTAFENAVSAGIGYAIVVPRYVDSESDDQELYLDWVPNVFSVYWDQSAVMPDRADMRFAFRVSVLPKDEYEAQWGTAPAELVNAMPDGQRARWFPSGQVVTADYYELVETKRKDRRPGKKHVVWRTINGLEVLAETTLPISRIPLVPCFGDQVFLEGTEDYRGMVRDAWDAQKAFNYWYTAITEQIALGSKAPYHIDPRQIEGFEEFWKNANLKNFPYLPAFRYVQMPDGSTVDMGVPSRDAVEPPIQAMTVALNYSDQALKQVMSLYDPSLGQRKSEQSGRAILALQQQGEVGNANYIDNLKRFLRSLGRLLLEMIPVYYDAPRVVRIIGTDEKPQTVMVHAGAENPPTEDQLPEGVSKIYDLSTGRYDVTVTTGPSFVNKRQEQLTRVIDFFKIEPQMAQIGGDIVAGLMEIPELQNRLKKALPPQFQEEGSPEADAAKMKQQMQMLMQQHELLVKELNAKTQAIETDQVKQQAQIAVKNIDADTQLAIQVMRNATSIEVARINAAKETLNQQMAALEERVALGHQAAHDVGLAAMEHAQTMQQGQQAHQQALEQGDQQQQGALEQGQQAADLAPEPAPAGGA